MFREAIAALLLPKGFQPSARLEPGTAASGKLGEHAGKQRRRAIGASRHERDFSPETRLILLYSAAIQQRSRGRPH